MGAEIMVSSAENPELPSFLMLFCLGSAVYRRVAFHHGSHAARNSAFLISALPVHVGSSFQILF